MAFVQTGDNVMIGGFIVQGTQPKRVIIRAIGPELGQFGVPDPFVFLGTFVFVLDTAGHVIVDPAFPTQSGRDSLFDPCNCFSFYASANPLLLFICILTSHRVI
jgi:hypothetical protein